MVKISRKLIVVLCFVLVIAISALSWTILRANRLSSSAQALAIQVVESTFTEDMPAGLITNSHPEFQAEFPPEQFSRYLSNIKPRIGRLESVLSIQGNSEIPFLTMGETDIVAKYEVELEFENTLGSVQVSMRLTQGQWLVTKFDIFADILSN